MKKEIISVLKLLFVISLHAVPMYYLKINKYIIIILIVFLLKKKRFRNDFDDLVESKLITRKKYKINKNNFFIIKKDKFTKNNEVIIDHLNILHYPSYKNNTIAVGDIILFINRKQNFFQKFLSFITNTKITHLGIINNFVIDYKNKLKFDVPENYYLVVPMITQSGAILDKFHLKTISSSYYFLAANLTQTFDLHHFRYKKINKIKYNIYKTLEKYNYTHYNLTFYSEQGISNLLKNWVEAYNIVFNTSYFGTFRKFYNFLLKYIISNNRKNISIEKLNNFDILIASNYAKLSKVKNKKEIKNITKNLKDLVKYKKRVKEEKGFVCSSFIYYIYKINGVDISNNYSFNINNIDYSLFFTPDESESLFTDDRFQYISTFYFI